jgi:IS30 family transposase
MIKDRASIHDRPKDIETRADIGHWEGDLIICKRTRLVLVLHERKSRVTLAARLARKTAAETISVMLAVFGRITPLSANQSRSTMTPLSPSMPCPGPCAI